MKHGIVTLYACAANTFLNLITIYLFSDNNKVAITIHVILKFQLNYLSRRSP